MADKFMYPKNYKMYGYSLAHEIKYEKKLPSKVGYFSKPVEVFSTALKAQSPKNKKFLSFCITWDV